MCVYIWHYITSKPPLLYYIMIWCNDLKTSVGLYLNLCYSLKGFLYVPFRIKIPLAFFYLWFFSLLLVGSFPFAFPLTSQVVAQLPQAPYFKMDWVTPVGTGTCSTWVNNIVQHLEVRNRRRSPLHFSRSPFSLFMSQHYSNAFIEKTMSPYTSNQALPFSDYLQRERWREPELIRSVCPRNISVPYCEVFRDSRVSSVSDHRTL